MVLILRVVIVIVVFASSSCSPTLATPWPTDRTGLFTPRRSESCYQFANLRCMKDLVSLACTARLGIEHRISRLLQVGLATAASNPRVIKWIQIICSGFIIRAASFRLSQFQNIKKIPIVFSKDCLLLLCSTLMWHTSNASQLS